MKTKTLFVRVYSDNFQGEIFEQDAYNELRLQMSTGDYACHKTEHVTRTDAVREGYVTLQDMLQDCVSCPTCGRG
jgi:hypothetical protein